MQILMGADHTVVHLRSVTIYYNEIVNYVKEEFSTHRIENNTIQLHYSDENHHKHLFLLKWLCALHRKHAKYKSEELKEALLNRMHKPVHIVCKNQIDPIYVIDVRVITNQVVRIRFKNVNYKLFASLYQKFEDMAIHVSSLHGYFDMRIDTLEKYYSFEHMRAMERFDGFKIKFLFNHNQMESLLNRMISVQQDENRSDQTLFGIDSPEVIKKRFKKLLAKYHPDTVFHEGPEKVQEYTEIFQQIQASFSLYIRSSD